MTVQRCPVCDGEGRVYRMTSAYEMVATQASGGTFGWTGQTHEWRECRACGGSGLLTVDGQPVKSRTVRR